VPRKKKKYRLLKIKSRIRRKGMTVKVSKKQIGHVKSIKADRRRKALTPGKRISRNGKIYYERRKNRSDKKGSRI